MPDIRLTLPDVLLVRVDEDRGDVPRVVWIRRAIADYLDRREGDTPVTVAAKMGQVRAIIDSISLDWEDALGPQEPLKMRHPLDSDDRSAAGDGGWSTKVVPGADRIAAARNTGVAGGTKGASPTPAKQPVRKTAAAEAVFGMLDHSWVGVGGRCMRMACPAPQDRERHLPDQPY